MQYWQYPNRVVLGGRISTDLNIKDVKESSKILNFNIANNLNSTGENKSRAGHFFQCEAWGKVAELISNMFKKGDPIIIEGTLHWTSWQDKNTGAKRDAVRLRVENFYFGGGSSGPVREDDEESEPRQEYKNPYGNSKPAFYPTAPAPVKNSFTEDPPADDEIPF